MQAWDEDYNFENLTKMYAEDVCIFVFFVVLCLQGEIEWKKCWTFLMLKETFWV